MASQIAIPAQWPELAFEDLKDTLETVQLWSQIVGKVRLLKTPWINHSWHVSLYVSPRGLTTGNISYEDGSFQIDFDFIAHELKIIASNGGKENFALPGLSVAGFYKNLFARLDAMGIAVEIYAKPSELELAIPFAEDEQHDTYNPDQMHRYWQALIRVNAVFLRFRSEFTGKCSPIHLFWGGFDLTVSRFSGKEAPVHQGNMPHMPLKVMQEAYSHEVSSVGFWAGSEQFPHPAFYCYCYPTPADFGSQAVEPNEAFYSDEMGEYFLLYEVVQRSENPEDTLLKFLRSTYNAVAKTANWDDKLRCDLREFEK